MIHENSFHGGMSLRHVPPPAPFSVVMMFSFDGAYDDWCMDGIRIAIVELRWCDNSIVVVVMVGL